MTLAAPATPAEWLFAPILIDLSPWTCAVPCLLLALVVVALAYRAGWWEHLQR